MANKIINIAAILSVVAILAGLIIAIWFGLIGIRIAATGIVTFAADWLLFWWIIRRLKRTWISWKIKLFLIQDIFVVRTESIIFKNWKKQL